jgi:type I restriction enzyme S subunit
MLTAAGLAASSASLLPPGSVLLSSRAPIGHVAINTVAMATNQGFKSFVPNPARVHAPYLYWWLRANRAYLQGLGNGATFKEISKAVVSRIEIPLPPISEQRRIADILNRADALRAKRRAGLEELDPFATSVFIEMFGNLATNPKGWPVVRLKEAVELVQIGPFGSLLHQSDYMDGGVPVINPIHIVNGQVRPNPRNSVASKHVERLHNYVLRKGDIVMGRRGQMGRCAVVGLAESGMLCGSGSLIIRPDTRRATPEYLHALLSSAYFVRILEHEALGVTMANLNSTIVEGLKLPLPTLDEQRRFGRFMVWLSSHKSRAAESQGMVDKLFASLQHRAFKGEL